MSHDLYPGGTVRSLAGFPEEFRNLRDNPTDTFDPSQLSASTRTTPTKVGARMSKIPGRLPPGQNGVPQAIGTPFRCTGRNTCGQPRRPGGHARKCVSSPKTDTACTQRPTIIAVSSTPPAQRIGGDPMTDPAIAKQMEQLRQRLETIQQDQLKAQERFAKLDTMKEEVAAIEASVTSRDRAVTVVAGPGAAVKAVSFTEEIKRMTPTQLSQTVTSTIQQAVADAARQQAAVVQNYIGDQVDILGRVLKTQEEVFGQPMQPTEAPSSSARSSSNEVSPEDELSGSAEPVPTSSSVSGRVSEPARIEYSDQDEEVSALRSEPRTARQPSTSSRSSATDDEFLKLYDGEDG